MTDVSILIPWRTDKGHRERIFNWTEPRWLDLLPDAELVVASDNGQPFNRARARNNAFANCFGDVLVIADADTTVPSSDQLTRAIDLAESGEWVLPYDVYYNLCREDTEELLRNRPTIPLSEPERWEFRLLTAESGVLVLPREAFVAVGGYDERFVGWGFEDRAFALALSALWRPPVRLPGYVVHLWHPVGLDEAFNSPTIHDNQARWLRYERATGNRELMAALVRR
jgi:hypothetical protein